MKRLLSLTLALLSGMVLASSAPLWAHEGHDGPEYKKELGITAEQQTKLDAIKQEQKSVMAGIMEKGKELHKKLQDQVDKKASDAELQATLSDMEINHKAMREQMEKFRQQREAVLTPMQRAKSALAMGEMRHEGMMRRHEMHKEMQGQ